YQQKGLLVFGVFSVVNILADSVGPGTIGIHGDSQHYFLSSAFMTMAIILLHMFWGVVFFDGCEKQRWWAVAAVVASHLMVSCLTFQNPEYVGSLVPTYIILFLMGVWAFYAAAGSLRNLKFTEDGRFVFILKSLRLPFSSFDSGCTNYEILGQFNV
uniref:Gamma-secretase subunit APH-1 n=1 Tax=Cyclopterus lumpus TaxID=8103 RepID=A0A8C2Z6H5_CYCLU